MSEPSGFDPAVEAILESKSSLPDNEYRRRLLEKVRLLGIGKATRDPFVGKQADYAYVLVFNDKAMIDLYLDMQYQLVTKATDPNLSSPYKNPTTGIHTKGDAILLRCPRDLMEAHNANRDLMAHERLTDSSESFLDWGNRAGVPVMKEANHGRT